MQSYLLPVYGRGSWKWAWSYLSALVHPSSEPPPRKSWIRPWMYHWGEPHTSDVNRDFPFVYMYIYICRPSFRIYLSFISTICCNISSTTRMRTRRRDTGANTSTWRKRASSHRGTKKKTEKVQKQISEISQGELQKLRLRGRKATEKIYVVLGRQSETFWVQSVYVRLQIQVPKNKWLFLPRVNHKFRYVYQIICI